MPAQGPEFADQGHRFSDALALFANTVRSERVDLATIDQFMGRRSIGALLLILALPMALPIPAPGISVLVRITAELNFRPTALRTPTRMAADAVGAAIDKP
jgi:hypothetical protein